MPYTGPRTDVEERATASRQRFWAQDDLARICEHLGAALASAPGKPFSPDDIGHVSETVCNRLYEHPDFKAVLADGAGCSGYELAERAMLAGAGIKRGEAA